MRALVSSLIILICMHIMPVAAEQHTPVTTLPAAFLELVARAPRECEADLFYVFRQVSLGKEVAPLIDGLRRNKCLDKYSSVGVAVTEPVSVSVYTEKRGDILYLQFNKFVQDTPEEIKARLAAA